MKSRILLIVLLASFSGLTQAAYYTVSPFDDQLRALSETNFSTIGSVPITLAGQTVQGGNGLAKHPTTGVVYALLKLQGVTNRHLVTLDLATGVATDVGDTGDKFANIAFAPDGTLYGVTGDGASTPETLYTINPVTAAPTMVATLGNGNDGEVIAVSAAGLIYHFSGLGTLNDAAVGRIMETIDPSNAFMVTNVPISGGDASTQEVTAAFFIEGALFVIDRSENVYAVALGGEHTDTGHDVDHDSPRGLIQAPLLICNASTREDCSVNMTKGKLKIAQKAGKPEKTKLSLKFGKPEAPIPDGFFGMPDLGGGVQATCFYDSMGALITPLSPVLVEEGAFWVATSKPGKSKMKYVNKLGNDEGVHNELLNEGENGKFKLKVKGPNLDDDLDLGNFDAALTVQKNLPSGDCLTIEFPEGAVTVDEEKLKAKVKSE